MRKRANYGNRVPEKTLWSLLAAFLAPLAAAIFPAPLGVSPGRGWAGSQILALPAHVIPSA